MYNPSCPEPAEPFSPACLEEWMYFNGEEWAEATGIYLACLEGENVFTHLIIKPCITCFQFFILEIQIRLCL